MQDDYQKHDCKLLLAAYHMLCMAAEGVWELRLILFSSTLQIAHAQERATQQAERQIGVLEAQVALATSLGAPVQYQFLLRRADFKSWQSAVMLDLSLCLKYLKATITKQ